MQVVLLELPATWEDRLEEANDQKRAKYQIRSCIRMLETAENPWSKRGAEHKSHEKHPGGR